MSDYQFWIPVIVSIKVSDLCKNYSDNGDIDRVYREI